MGTYITNLMISNGGSMILNRILSGILMNIPNADNFLKAGYFLKLRPFGLRFLPFARLPIQHRSYVLPYFLFKNNEAILVSLNNNWLVVGLKPSEKYDFVNDGMMRFPIVMGK